ncbi:cytochrome bc complex cytochrome b subunit [bacterium]|nr:cytochrome bc complex cytochrome b subunit [bacterium]
MTKDVNEIATGEPEKTSSGPDRLPTWIESRIESCDLFDAMIPLERLRSGLGEGVQGIDLVGKALWITFAVVVITGIVLLAGYSPSTAGAFSSVVNIQNGGGLGWLMRGAHKYGTDLFVILAVIRLARIAFRRSYKSGGEITWIAAIGVLLVGIISGVTGYLLVWNQRIFTSERLLDRGVWNFEDIYPLGGLGLRGWVGDVLLGPDGLSQEVLTRVFEVHIGLSLIVIFLVFFWRNMKRNQVPVYSHFSLKIPVSLIWTIIGGLLFLALVFPVPLGIPSDGVLKPHPIFADWYALAFYEFTSMFQPGMNGVILSLGVLLAILLPWVDRSVKQGPRPAVTTLIVASLLTWFILTIKALGWEITYPEVLITLSVIWFVSFAVGYIREFRERKPEIEAEDGGGQ